MEYYRYNSSTGDVHEFDQGAYYFIGNTNGQDYDSWIYDYEYRQQMNSVSNNYL